MNRRPVKISRGEVLMFLALANYHRTHAAQLAGVARQTFQNRMRQCRVRAPVLATHKKLNAQDVRLIRALIQHGVPVCEISRKFEESHRLISGIKSGSLYRWAR